jgi:hypothetical protein
MSQMSFVGPAGYNTPFPYVTNWYKGGRRFRDSLGRVRDQYPDGSAVNYGVDIVVLGDSTGTFADIYSSWPHFLKVRLQETFNRPGVTGGFGYMPFSTQNSATNDWIIHNVYTITCTAASATVGATYTNNGVTFTVAATIAGATTLIVTGISAPAASGTLTKASGTGDATITYASFVTTAAWSVAHNSNVNQATGLCQVKLSAAAAHAKIFRRFDPTLTAGTQKRQGVSDWQYVGLSYSGVANSVFCDSSTTAGAITPSTTVAGPDGGGAEQWGAHYTLQTGVNPLVANTIQVASRATTDQVWANGAILFNGDTKEGIRLHNLSSVGSTSDNWYVSGDATMLRGNITNWSTGANTAGALNAKLFLINLMLNDCGATSEAISVAAFKVNMQGLITQIAAATSKPCVGLIINQPWSSGIANAASLLRYNDYRDAIYQLADANPDTVFVIDFWKDLSDSTYPEYAPHGRGDLSTGAMYDRGWYNDGTHGSDRCNMARAGMLYSILTYGV